MSKDEPNDATDPDSSHSQDSGSSQDSGEFPDSDEAADSAAAQPEPGSENSGVPKRVRRARSRQAAAAAAAAAGSEADADESDPQEPEDAEPSEQSRGLAVLGVTAAVILGLLAWMLFLRDSEEPVAAPVTTTTTTTETTTPPTSEALRPAPTAQVATAKPEATSVAVLHTAPPEWETAQPVTIWDVPELPSSQVQYPPRDALPRVDYPIQGRTATETGWDFSNPTPFGGPLNFVVTETRGNWAKVMLPVRPNQTEGWINTDTVDLSEHDYKVELRLSDNQLTVYKGSEVIADTTVVVGKDSSRTPTGRFYITDKENRDPSGFYGPHVLPLNGYSEQMDIFDDGVPVIAMHGTSRPDLLGQDVSNGCVRLPNEVITQLNADLPLGTPVEIIA